MSVIDELWKPQQESVHDYDDTVKELHPYKDYIQEKYRPEPCDYNNSPPRFYYGYGNSSILITKQRGRRRHLGKHIIIKKTLKSTYLDFELPDKLYVTVEGLIVHESDFYCTDDSFMEAEYFTNKSIYLQFKDVSCDINLIAYFLTNKEYDDYEKEDYRYRSMGMMSPVLEIYKYLHEGRSKIEIVYCNTFFDDPNKHVINNMLNTSKFLIDPVAPIVQSVCDLGRHLFVSSNGYICHWKFYTRLDTDLLIRHAKKLVFL